MAVRSVLVLLATAGLVTSVSAVAVGLGEIRLQSTINQPLAAEIELLSVEGREASQIRARLGSPEDFARAGLQRPFALTGLAFRPVLDAAGGPVLKVTSPQSIREPFLDFLVRLEWPDGQLLRAYTVLLDLPEQGVQPPLARRSGPATFETGPSEKHQSQQRSPGVSPLRRPAIAPDGGSYTVRSGDTLWSVASRARPQGATVQQTLMAIYRENPEAFIDGDMNRMRRDYALRVPEAGEVAAIDAEDARATVWREAGEGLSAALAPTATAAPSSDTDTGTATGQLRLAAPQLDTPSDSAMASSDATAPAGVSSAAVSAVGAGHEPPEGGLEPSSGAAEANGAVLSADAAEKILYLEEEVLLTRRENRELHERIDNLEEQLSVMSRLVELQSDTVAASQLAEPTETAALPADAPVEVPVEAPVEASNAESGMFSKAWLALGGLAVLLLGGMVVRKRRHQQGDELAAPALFMTHEETGARAGEPETSEQKSGIDGFAESAPDQSEEDTAEDTFPATGFDDDTERDALDPVAAFAVTGESSEDAFTALTAEESMTTMSESDEQPDGLAGAERFAPLVAVASTETADSGDVEPDDEAPLEPVLETELEYDLDLDMDLELDLELGDLDLPSLEAGQADLAADEFNGRDVEEPGAAYETSLEKWFAELAEEPSAGQNNGTGAPRAVAEVSENDRATVVASNSDYRVATTFDLDFAAFSEQEEALAQRDPFQTRLELARVYIDMQDSQSAREILEELAAAANEDVQREARELLHSLG